MSLHTCYQCKKKYSLLILQARSTSCTAKLQSTGVLSSVSSTVDPDQSPTMCNCTVVYKYRLHTLSQYLFNVSFSITSKLTHDRVADMMATQQRSI